MASEQNNTVYIVTGANKGIRLSIIKALLARDCTTIITTIHNNKAAATL
jgi:NAD(P)-dependent dehydrogenase (short-subunit alcohol dehydrogenase family)